MPKTGQTSPTDTGSDGDLQKGVAWPDPRFTDNGDGTVRDNLTRLTWDTNANRFGQQTWSNALNSCNDLAVGLADDGSTLDDWRLPNVREIQSLVDYGVTTSPVLPIGNPFDNVQSSSYWSSTTYAAGNTIDAWYVYFYLGGVYNDNKVNGDKYVWCVRGGP